MVEIREVLRAWLAGHGLRVVATQAGVDRKTARRYVEAAVAAGLDRAGGVDQLDDALIGTVVTRGPPRPPARPWATAWDVLCTNHVQIERWIDKGLTVVKIGDVLARQGVLVPHRTLHRYCHERTKYQGRRRAGTVPVVDGEPVMECQIDFARVGMPFDSVTGRRRVVHALIFTAVYSRHMFVWLTFSQTLTAMIDGCEGAWAFFDGVFKVLIPDNTSAIVAHADSVNPQLTVGWLEYSQARASLPTRPGSHTCKTNRVSSAWSSTCATISSPAKSSLTLPMPNTEPSSGAPRKPVCASTAPPAPSRR